MSTSANPRERVAAAVPRHAPAAANVGYFINSYPSPSLTFIRREIEAIERSGRGVTRYCVRRWDAALIDPADQVEAERCQVLLEAGWIALTAAFLRVLLQNPTRLARAVRLAWRVGRVSDRGLARHVVYLIEACLLLAWTRRDHIDHLHVHFGTNATKVAMLCRVLGGPHYSFTVHGPEEFDRPAAICLTEKIEHAAFVVGISSFGRSQLFRWCSHSDWPKIHVVRCGLDKQYAANVTPPPAAPRLVSIGRLHEQKGTLLLVEAAAQLRKRNVELDLTLIGDGPMRGVIEQAIEQYGLGDCVHLAGWRKGSEIQSALGEARALVLPSFAEGLPVVLMEALARHRPVITTYIAGIPELVDHRCGWLVPAGAVEPLVDAMHEALLAAPEKLAEMGAVGASRVRRWHDIDEQSARLLELIDRSVASRTQSPG